MVKINKIELRKLLLEGMCRCAEKIDIYFLIRSNIRFYGNECPEPFKPGTADKFIFNKIIDKVIDNVLQEYENDCKANIDTIGVGIMAKFYYPQYGNWRTLDRAKVRLLYNL